MTIERRCLLLLPIALAALAGCPHDDDHPHNGGHSSPYPSCDAIIKACHMYDVGAGPVNDCHGFAHEATSDATCAPRKDACLRTCADAATAADGGAADAAAE